MTELETKTEAETPEFADEPCDELTDEALDRTEGELVVGTASVTPW